MVWREMSLTDQRLEFVRLALQEGCNFSLLCRRTGISRSCGYKWLERFAREGVEGLGDRSRRPLSSPGRIGPDMEGRILAVRDAHPAWGARKIRHVLLRDGGDVPAVSSIHGLLQRSGRIAERRGNGPPLGRFQKGRPNEQWQMDFKGRYRLLDGQWCYPLTMLDDHSRFSLTITACGNERGVTVKPLMENAFRLYGLPDAIYVDNGNPWGAGVPGAWTGMRVWLAKLDIDLIHGSPYHPQGRGKIERLHASLKAELLATRSFRDMRHMQKEFDAWRTIYNCRRPHEALDMDVPASRYQPSRRSMPENVTSPVYQEGEVTRKVSTTKSYVHFAGRQWNVPKAFRGETLAIRPIDGEGTYSINFGARQIVRINLREQT